MRRAVRSEPAPGSVRAKAGQALAAGQARQEAPLLLGGAEGPHRIDGADAAVDRGQAGDRRVDGRHPRQERGEGGERRPEPPYSRSTSRPQ